MGFDETLKAKLEEAAKTQPERKRVMLYLDPETYEALKAFAGERRLSSSQQQTGPSPVC